ncbi:MAG: hypothetical protein U9R58_14925 [Chloroflexota bacterium]|nr:hypothetical protein [Chloroflexota bacterium]
MQMDAQPGIPMTDGSPGEDAGWIEMEPRTPAGSLRHWLDRYGRRIEL